MAENPKGIQVLNATSSEATVMGPDVGAGGSLPRRDGLRRLFVAGMGTY